MESLSLPDASKHYIALLKERFHGTKSETFHKFKHILVKYVAETTTVDTTRLFSEVNALFAERHDLIEIFRDFLYQLDHSSVDSNREYLPPLIPDQKSIKIVMGSCVDFMNRVQRVLNDDNKLNSFMMIITGFQKHLDIKRVGREAGFLFKEHPELEIELAEFLAAANARTSVQDALVSKKRKRSEAEKRANRSKGRQWSSYEDKMFEYEDELYKKDLSYNFMLRAKEGAERLLKDHLGTKKLRGEKIRTADYFKGLNLEFMKTELKMENKLLSKKWMKREKAIRRSDMLVSYLEKDIEILSRSWSEEKKNMIRKSHEADLEIPAFDWHDAR